MVSLVELFSRKPADLILGVINKGAHKTVGIIEDPMAIDPDDVVRLAYPIDFFMVITRTKDGVENYKPVVTNTELGQFDEDVTPFSAIKLKKADGWLGDFYLGAVKALPGHRINYQTPEINNSFHERASNASDPRSARL